MRYAYIKIPFESTFDCKQPNIDSGAGREKNIIKGKVVVLTCSPRVEGEVAAIEGTTFPFEREE
jgi:hypothetical protein